MYIERWERRENVPVKYLRSSRTSIPRSSHFATHTAPSPVVASTLTIECNLHLFKSFRLLCSNASSKAVAHFRSRSRSFGK